MINRLERFRAFMQSLDPTGNPSHALERGQYVAPPHPLADKVAPRIELEPACTHIIFGCIGSGKTTQLLVTRDRLAELPDTEAFYVDVSAEQDLEKIRAGVLVALAGLELGKAKRSNNVSRRALEKWAKDRWGHRPDDEPFDYDPYVEFIPGVVTPPRPPLDDEIREMLPHLEKLRGKRHVVLFFDGLDRLHDKERFTQLVHQDVHALRTAGIGVVLIAPLDMALGVGRNVIDFFDYSDHVRAVNVGTPAGERFFTSVIRARLSTETLPPPACRKLVQFSGGVLRDLIKLARLAATEAYARGADAITPEHVESVADAFGRDLLSGGVGKDGLEVLQKLRTQGQFIPTTPRDERLLATSRVLEYERARYVVHPTLVPLLEKLAVKA